MRCEQASELMSLRLDHYQDEATDLDQHLATCVACTSEWASLQAVTRLFENPPMLQPGPNFTARVMARVADRRAPQVNPWRNVSGWVILALGALGLALVALSPLALSAWQATWPLVEAARVTWAAEGLLGLASFFVWLEQSLTAAPQAALSLVRLVPPPLVVGYLLTTLLMVMAWVVLVSHFNLQRNATGA